MGFISISNESPDLILVLIRTDIILIAVLVILPLLVLILLSYSLRLQIALRAPQLSCPLYWMMFAGLYEKQNF